MTSNRSPSSLSTRPNPNSRNSETNSSIRKSFSGNPFAKPSLLTNPRSFNSTTPNNSPADHTKRQSLGREGNPSSGICEEKENESKAAKIRSPVTKGSKNFMSPTISAASKFTPSPRKKILAERNELTRTSIQLSDSKVPLLSMEDNSDPKSETLSGLTNIDQKQVVLEVPPVSQVTSIQFSDSKVPLLSMEDNSDPKSETLSGLTKIDQKQVVLEVPPVSRVTLNSKDDSEWLSEVTENSDCVNVESSSKSKSFCSSAVSPIIAPLDADPSLPPYDPKTNFLSPRPRFLHYKPNPRIEVFLNKEKEVDSGEIGNKLEDSFILSENSSDTDVTEESQSEDSNKESEGLSSVETTSEEEKEPVISEPIPISTPTPEHEQAFETKRVSKPKGFFMRSKSIPLLLVFLIACVSISLTDSPVMDSSVFKDVSFSKLYYDPSKLAAFAKANLDGFAKSCKQWSSNSISYLSDLKFHHTETYKSRQWSSNSVSYLSDLKFHHTETYKSSPIQFINLTTAPQEDFLVDGYVKANLDDKKVEESLEPVEEETVEEREADIGTMAEEEESQRAGDAEIEVEQAHQQELDVDDNNEKESERAGETEIEAEKVIQTLESDAHLQININVEDGSVLISHVPERKPEEIELPKAEVEVFYNKPEFFATDLNSPAEIESSAAEIESKPEEIELPEVKTEVEVFYNKPDVFYSDLNSLAEIESPAAEINESELVDNGPANMLFSVQNLVGISLILSSLVAATIFIYMKKGKNTAPITVANFDPLLVSKKESPKQEVSHNWETEVDLLGESCPSEMSSFQKSSSYSKRVVRETSEAQSQERRPRKNYKRESLASSSEYSMGGSPSYGSFTTYERIPIKHASSGEEEMLTPIRRSSRLVRHQVTSS